jgi:phospholipase C
MVVASPWSRGGWVNSQVFDHTSSLQFLEHFLEHKTGKKITETNISSWRRAVCGDLTSIFRPFDNSVLSTPAFPAREAFFESIHQARFKGLPSAFRKLDAAEIGQINKAPRSSPLMPQQEKGTRPSSALPYELLADVEADVSTGKVTLRMEAGTRVFGSRSAGAPFLVYAPGGFRNEPMRVWSYAVAPGEWIHDAWNLDDFEHGVYHLEVHGPNGFFREFRGNAASSLVSVSCSYHQGNLLLSLLNNTPGTTFTVKVTDNAYGNKPLVQVLGAGDSKTAFSPLHVPAAASAGWYDISVRIEGDELFKKRYAGRVETGKPSSTDPAMGLPFR